MSEPTEGIGDMSIKDEEKQEAGDEDDVVNPWEVATHSATGVDYDKLISEYSISVNDHDNKMLFRFTKNIFIENCHIYSLFW